MLHGWEQEKHGANSNEEKVVFQKEADLKYDLNPSLAGNLWERGPSKVMMGVQGPCQKKKTKALCKAVGEFGKQKRTMQNSDGKKSSARVVHKDGTTNLLPTMGSR